MNKVEQLIKFLKGLQKIKNKHTDVTLKLSSNYVVFTAKSFVVTANIHSDSLIVVLQVYNLDISQDVKQRRLVRKITKLADKCEININI